MQLEELQQQWRQLDQKLDRALAFQAEIANRAIVQPARRRLNRSAIWPALDVIFCMGGLFACGNTLAEYGGNWQIALPAIALMLGLIALLANSIGQLRLVADLDWTGSICEIQRALDQLRVAKLRQFKWVILLSPLMGFCGLIVALQWLFAWLTDGRLQILDKLDTAWVIANYAFGVFCIPAGQYFARTLARWYQHRPWWRGVLDGISGKSLRAAALDVERWANLQRESEMLSG